MGVGAVEPTEVGTVSFTNTGHKERHVGLLSGGNGRRDRYQDSPCRADQTTMRKHIWFPPCPISQALHRPRKGWMAKRAPHYLTTYPSPRHLMPSFFRRDKDRG